MHRPEAEIGVREDASAMPRFGGPGGDLLSHALRHSTIGARGLNDRVRDGIGWGTPAITTGSAETDRDFNMSY